MPEIQELIALLMVAAVIGGYLWRRKRLRARRASGCSGCAFAGGAGGGPVDPLELRPLPGHHPARPRRQTSAHWTPESRQRPGSEPGPRPAAQKKTPP